ncbi:hypothetical protein H257_07936 [Aphanomyces astaci]|uniref:Uncharacterized protein n=1 Tax=Aphanomyces astaci TaxID=112090 RepID=W4GH42_APHAT|nr:hypothetical protein H257_07936 [Aphanomyces astaci]ETV78374.1 hypothetical protein H257_07936 [Aphanomyces astaci]|eukprot:XP_009831955.1 hypothetical protein H257_07936 [Aphanomyces astaci]
MATRVHLFQNVLTSPAFQSAIRKRREVHCIHTTLHQLEIRICMHSLWTRMICAVYRRRMDRVLDAVGVAVTTKSNWDSYSATVTAEYQVALVDDMHSVIDGHHGWL